MVASTLADNTPAGSVMVSLMSPLDREIMTAKTGLTGTYTMRVDYPGQYVVFEHKSGSKVAAIAIVVRPAIPP